MPAKPDAGNTLGAADRTYSGVAGDVPDAIRRRYLTDEKGGAGLGFYLDATVQQAAFRDHGRRLSLERADPNAIRDAVAIAKHRGWKIIDAQGSAAFRRGAWLAGRQAGLEVRGYRPSERDLQELERRLERRDREASRDDGQVRSDSRQRPSPDPQSPGGSQRADRRGAAQMRVVEAVVRARVSDQERQQAIMNRARQRIADWLERGAHFEQTNRSRPPERQRAR